MCVVHRSIQSWKDVSISASDPSMKMMRDLVNSANDICMFFGIFVTIWEISFLARLFAADNFSSNVSTVEENLLARASFLRMSGVQIERSTAEENFRLFPKQQTTKAVVERTNETTYKEFFDSVKSLIAQKSWRSGNSFERDLQESALASTFSDRKIENIYAPFLYHLGYLRNEIQ